MKAIRFAMTLALFANISVAHAKLTDGGEVKPPCPYADKNAKLGKTDQAVAQDYLGVVLPKDAKVRTAEANTAPTATK